MAKPAQTEMQLSAMASAVDRANRPTSLLTVPALVLVAAFLFCMWSYRGLAAERSALRAKQSELARIDAVIRDIETEKKKGIDLEKAYPPAPYFGSYVEDVWKKDLAGQFKEPPTVGQVTQGRVDTTSPLTRSEMTVTVANEPLEAILKAIEGTLNREFLKGQVFLSQVQLTPTGTGWRAVARFSLYEKR
jgi:hypothetical protein